MEHHERSSSNDLSDVPTTDNENPFIHPLPATRQPLTSSSTINNIVNVQKSNSPASISATRQENVPVKKKVVRKKKEVDQNAPPVEKKPRKTKTTTGSSPNPRKKMKTEQAPATVLQHVPVAQNLNTSILTQPTIFSDSRIQGSNEAAKITQNGFSNTSPAMKPHTQSTPILQYSIQQTEPTVQPRTRNMFDPVRGIERPEQTPPQQYSHLTATPPKQPMQRTSASPAISSLINHPDPGPAALTLNSRPQSTHVPVPDPAPKSTPRQPSPVEVVKKSDKVMTDTESKPKKMKEIPPPEPIGSGLLNSSFFGGDGPTEKPELGKGVSVVLEIPLVRGENNKVFNFAKLAEEKYGFAAVYPRQAANKERLAKVAAAGAALERSASGSKRGETSVGESGEDDGSVDLDRDSDNDGDVNMGGVNGTNENSGTDAPAPRKRRAKKDEYDFDDGFVDDSEALWEAQAVASRDGFFVYMGPLRPEVEAPSDKNDAVAKRGGKGSRRGGGPGSRGGRGSAAAGSTVTSRTTTSTAKGGAARKPRVTKAEREQMEKEKDEREQAAAALSMKQPQPVPVS